MTKPFENRNLFEGKLVRLSPFQPEDAQIMSTWTESYDYLRRMDTDYAVPTTASESHDKDQRGSRGSSSVQFRLRTLESNELIGFVALHGIEWNNQSCLMAIGIGNPHYRGQGYGSDALRLILQYAFLELNLNRVGLDVIGNNESAIRAYERVGLRREGAMRSAVLRDNRSYDRIIMGVLRNEWLELQE